MYHAHWGLSRSPFAGGATLLFYQGEAQLEALARLRYAAQQQRHALLLGERGVGKSLLVRRFADERRREARQVVSISLPGLSPRELLWQIAAGLSLAPRPEEDLVRLYRRLSDHAASRQNEAAMLLLDDADQIGPDVRTQLLRLLSLGGGPPWLTLVLTATTTAVGRIGEDLLEPIDLRIDLEPWSESETTGYIQHALIAAGGDRPVFDDEALSALYLLTDGIPRRVNRLADHALLGAAAEGLEMVDAGMIEAAQDALRWTVAAGSDA